jgi:ribonucleoside-diphosphate reductase alpha chain
MPSQTPSRQVGCGKIYVTICPEENNPQILKKVIINLGKSGGCAAAMTQAMAQCITLAIKYGCPIQEIGEELKNITCHQQTEKSLSCPDAVAKIMENYIDEITDNGNLPEHYSNNEK